MMENNLHNILKNNAFVGIVEDNNDPFKQQRVKVRIPFLHSTEIATNDLKWSEPKRNNNGLTFTLPDIQKIVNVYFPSGDLYYSVYDNAEHLNINLQNKVSGLSDDDYPDFISLCYNHNTQIFISNTEGLNINYKFNGINIKEDSININLKDNQTELKLGDPTASQEAINGTNWIEVFDAIFEALLVGYIGNLGAQVIPTPQLLNAYNLYLSRKEDILSKHVFLIENNMIRPKEIDVTGQRGDTFLFDKAIKKINPIIDPINFKPKPITEGKGIAEQNQYNPPSTDPNVPDSVDVPNNDGDLVSSTDATINKIIKVMHKDGYEVFTKPFILNIVGVRKKIKDDGIITNKFDDKIYVFFTNASNKVESRTYRVTTTPGFKKNAKTLPDTPVAQVAYGQYKNVYKLGFHQNRTGKAGGKTKPDGSLYPQHRALTQSKIGFFRNNPTDTTYTNQKKTKVNVDSIGTNIHHASDFGTTGEVFNFSSGCQVFSSKPEHDEFISLCDQQVSKGNLSTFTYTLISENELNNI